MADFPTVMYPSDADNKSVEIYIDLQKQLNALIEQHKTSMEGIEGVNINIERRLKGYVRLQRDATNQQEKTLNALIQHQKQYYSAIKNGEEEQFHDKKRALEFEMFQRGALIKRLQMQFDYEKDLAKKAYDEKTKTLRLTMDILSKQFGVNIKMLQTHKAITNELVKTHGMSVRWAGAIAAVIVVLQEVLEIFKKFDSESADFRISMGLTRDTAKNIRLENEKLAIALMNVGVSLKDVYKTSMTLGASMGGVHNVTLKLKETVSLMKAQYGVAEENTVGLLRNMAAIAGTTMEVQEYTVGWAAHLSRAAGVPLNDVMKDIATKSSATLSLMTRIPRKIVEAAIEARRMNSSLDNMAKSSESLLNFTDSIQSEMEASVLLGRAINLQKARELAFAGDLVESTKEIVNIARDIDFSNLNYFQKKSFANAVGRSVDELNKMIVATEELEKARLDNKLAPQIKKYEELRKIAEDVLKTESKNVLLKAREEANQDRMKMISSKFSQIWARLAEDLLPKIDEFLGYVVKHMEEIMIGFGIVWAGFKYGKTIIESITHLFSKLTASQRVFNFFANTLLLGSRFGKMVPLIGQIVTVIEAAIYGFINAFNALKDIFRGDWIKAAFRGILGPLIVIEKMIESIVGLFSDDLANKMGAWVEKTLDDLSKIPKRLWNSFKLFIEKSPLEMGLSIVKLFTSVGSMIFDALISPFTAFLAWISDKIPGLSKVSSALKGGVRSIMGTPTETNAANSYVEAIKITPEVTKAAGISTNTPIIEKRTESGTNESNNLMILINEIKGLRQDMKDGKIGISMDGQLLSATLARQTEFRGGYGVNKIAY